MWNKTPSRATEFVSVTVKCVKAEKLWKATISSPVCVIIYACLYNLLACLDYHAFIVPNPCVLHVRPLNLNAKINPRDNQAHPDLDIYSLLFLWRPGHLFRLLAYGLLKQRLSHPKHSWLFTFALAVGALGGLGRRGRAKMGCRDISVTPWTVQDVWKKVSRKV